MPPGPPAWLERLQSDLTDALRVAPAHGPDPSAVPSTHWTTALQHLAGSDKHSATRWRVYHRQYWLRLVATFETEFPWTLSVLNPSRFTPAVISFLLRHPPVGQDIVQCTQGFGDWLLIEHAGSSTDGSQDAHLRDALQVDEAWRAALGAPPAALWDPASLDESTLPTLRLQTIPGFSLIEIGQPWVPHRRPPAGASASPTSSFRHWIIAPGPAGPALTGVSVPVAALLGHLQRQPLATALAAWAQEAPAGVAPSQIQRWFSEAVHAGWWRHPRAE